MEHPTLHFRYKDDHARFRVIYENGDSEDLWLTKVGSNLYRLQESSFVGDAAFGGTIRCDLADDGSLFFQEITEQSKLKTQSWILSAEFLATDHVRSILDSVAEAGGMWEQAFGGLLMVHVPAEIANDIFDQLKDASSNS